MQTVSAAWKAEQLKSMIDAEAFVEITLEVADPLAQSNATASDNGHEAFSKVGNVVIETDEAVPKYATLEQNIWILDNSLDIVGEPYGESGYIGNVLSDASSLNYPTSSDGAYPTVTISFSQVFANLIPGISIAWSPTYNEWAESFRITAYNGSTVVAQKLVENNSAVNSNIAVDIQNYNRITIEIIKWSLPNHRPRIENILVGIKRVYDKNELMSYSHSQFVDPMSAELPKNEITFELLNLDGEYNLENPEGTVKYLIERQEIKVRYGYQLESGMEWINGGRFVLSEWETPQNGITATFVARDLLEYMTDKYTGTTSGTLYDIATAALTQAGLPLADDGTVRWVLDSSLSSITAPSGVTVDNSIAEVLQLIANAACCVMYQDRKGRFHIEPLTSGEAITTATTDYLIDRDISYANADISLSKPLKEVNVNDGAATVTVGTQGETQPVKNPFISADRAATVAQWVADYLVNRRTLNGTYRADPRLDALDRATVENQFSESVILITDVEYTYNGAFRGSYEGRATGSSNSNS